MIALRLILPATDQRVELDGPAPEVLDLPRRRREHGCPPRGDQRIDVTGDEENRVHLGKGVPGHALVVAARSKLRPDGRDRALSHLVDVRECPPLRPGIDAGVDVDTAFLELCA